MSLQSELAELIEWLAELTAEAPGGSDPEPLPRDDWQLVRDNLEKAVGHFNSAGDMFPEPSAKSPRDVSADLAYDLAFEAQAMAARAYVLGRRARPKVEKSADELTRELESKAEANKRLTTQVKNLKAKIGELEAGLLETPEPPVAVKGAQGNRRTVKAEKTPAEWIDAGEVSVETARKNLFNVTPSEPAVIEFSLELDVLNDLIAGWRRVNRRSA